MIGKEESEKFWTVGAEEKLSQRLQFIYLLALVIMLSIFENALCLSKLSRIWKRK